MPYAAVRELDVYYEVHGDGPGRALFINGTGGDLRHLPTLGQGPLERTFTTLYYDQRNLGRTSKPAGPVTMADYADDAAGLLDALGWERAHVVGVSFGGMVAQHLAIRHPGRVDRLVLACTSAGGAGGASADLLALEDLPEPERRRRAIELLDTRSDLEADPPVYAPGVEVVAQMMGRLRDGRADPEVAAGARRQLEARAGHDAWDDLERISAPTLVIGGRYDAQAPPANSERLAARIPGAALRLCEGGHLFLWQDPEAWPAIIAFLTGPLVRA